MKRTTISKIYMGIYHNGSYLLLFEKTNNKVLKFHINNFLTLKKAPPSFKCRPPTSAPFWLGSHQVMIFNFFAKLTITRFSS